MGSGTALGLVPALIGSVVSTVPDGVTMSRLPLVFRRARFTAPKRPIVMTGLLAAGIARPVWVSAPPGTSRTSSALGVWEGDLVDAVRPLYDARAGARPDGQAGVTPAGRGLRPQVAVGSPEGDCRLVRTVRLIGDAGAGAGGHRQPRVEHRSGRRYFPQVPVGALERDRFAAARLAAAGLALGLPPGLRTRPLPATHPEAGIGPGH